MDQKLKDIQTKAREIYTHSGNKYNDVIVGITHCMAIINNSMRVTSLGIILADDSKIQDILWDLHLYAAVGLMDTKKNLNDIHTTSCGLFKKKNADYGNAFATHGVVGILVRICDKINRLINITRNGCQVVDERVEDTLMDLHLYAALALLIIHR